MRARRLVAIAWAASGLLASADAAFALDPNRRITEYTIRVWGETAGLPQATVRALAQARDGHLWIATEAELSRFDGVRFETHDARDTPGLDAQVRTLLVDGEGDLWVGLMGGSTLLRYRERRFERMDGGLGFPPGHAVISSLEDRAGRLWFGSWLGVAVREARGYRQLRLPEGTPRGGVWAIEQAADGTVWIGLFAGLGRLAVEGRGIDPVPLPASASPTVRALAAEPDGALWVGTDSDLLRRGPDGGWRRYGASDGVPAAGITALLRDSQGSLWIGTTAGLARRRPAADGFEVLGSPELPDGWIRSLFEDREGNLWLGTRSVGLVQMTNGKLGRLTRADGLPSERAASVLAGRDGTLWIGTSGDGLIRFREGRARRYTAREGLCTDVVYGLAEDRRGRLWVAGGESAGSNVCALDLETDRWRSYTRSDGSRVELARVVHADAGGDVWVGADRLLRLDGDRLVPEPPVPGAAGDAYVFSLMVDRAGGLGSRGAPAARSSSRGCSPSAPRRGAASRGTSSASVSGGATAPATPGWSRPSSARRAASAGCSARWRWRRTSSSGPTDPRRETMPTRRAFIRSAATGALAYPLLAGFEPFVGRGAAAAAPAAGPKRLVIFWVPQGNCVGLATPDPFWPSEGGRLDFKLSRVLAPLERHRRHLLLLKGFHLIVGNNGTCKATGGIADGAHGAGPMCGLTNTCPVPASPDTPLGRSWGGGISIDQEIARAVGRDSLRPSLVLTGGGIKTTNHRGFVSYAGPARPVTPEKDPRAVYDALFGAATGQPPDKLAQMRALRRSALDTLRGDVRRLRARVPPDEQHKLDAQLEAVRLLERGFEAAACDRARPDFPDRLPTFPTQHTLHFKTIAAAFACNLTRVVTYMAASAGGDTAGDLSHFDGWKVNYHSTGHASGGSSDGGGTDPAVRAAALETMIKVSTYYARQLADFVDLLKSIPEGSGTVFDNTVIYWCAEMAHGNHAGANMPHAIIGGGWHFRTGQYLSYPAPHRYETKTALGGYAHDNTFGNILIALANALGHPLRTFGEPNWVQPMDKYADMLMG